MGGGRGDNALSIIYFLSCVKNILENKNYVNMFTKYISFMTCRFSEQLLFLMARIYSIYRFDQIAL